MEGIRELGRDLNLDQSPSVKLAFEWDVQLLKAYICAHP